MKKKIKISKLSNRQLMIKEQNIINKNGVEKLVRKIEQWIKEY